LAIAVGNVGLTIQFRCRAVASLSRSRTPAGIIKLPKAEHEAAEWQAAMEALLVATSGGPTMFARIGVRALNRACTILIARTVIGAAESWHGTTEGRW
jgi:hypothetical protein